MTRSLGFVVMALVASCIRGDCTSGTLKCNRTVDPAIAEICDNRNGYVMNVQSGACEKKTVDGCELVAPDEASNPCFKCEKGKVFDLERTKCVDVAADLKQENCLRYAAENSQCEECEEGFFLRNGECLAVTQKVANCEVYSGEKECFKCKSRFRLDLNECVAFTPVLACRFQTDRICDKCEDGFQLAPREPTQQLTTIDYLKDLLVADRNTNWWLPQTTPLDFCLEQQVTNCSKVKNAFQCNECDSGYFINSSLKCVKNPYKSVPKCAKYKDKDTCVKCEEGFYLGGNPLSCKAATSIEKCVEYEAFSDRCKKCENDYYWDDEKRVCTLRENNSVVQCKTYNDYKDECTSCNSGYSFSDDKLACFKDIENCETQMQASNKLTERHTCTKCNDNHVYLENECQVGNLDQCLVYTTGEMKCLKCKVTHYVKDDVCEPRTILNCKEFKNDTSNECSVCDSNFYEDGGDCTLHNLNNCVEYVDNKNECITCNSGFYEDSKVCKPQQIDHCYEYTKNKNECEKCSIGYYLDSKACTAVSKPHCHTYTRDTNDCEACSEGYYLSDKSCLKQNVSKCIQYTSGTNTCTKCQAGTYMSAPNTCSDQTGDQCIEWTPNTNECIKCQAGYWLDINTCVEQNVVNCLVHENNKGTCQTCATGYYLSTPITCTKLEIPGCVEYNTSNGECTQCSAEKYLAFGSCISRNVVNCIEYTSNTNNCSKCGAGYFLNSGDNICQRFSQINCVEFDTSGVCTTCAKGFRLDQNKTCVLVFQDRCIEYNDDGSCKTCEANTYLQGGNCIRFSGENCIIFDKANGNCTACAINYYLENFVCKPKYVEGCIEYEIGNNKDCKVCSGNRLKISGTECKALDFTNCIDVDENGNCNSCGLGYWLDGTVCKLQFVENCVKYEVGSTNCEKCADGYHNSSSTICELREQESCIEFDESTNECSKCQAGYYLDTNDSNKCKKPFIEHCIDYQTDSTICSKCMAGYVLDGQECKILLQDNCIKFVAESDECEKCAAGYILDGGKDCVKPIKDKCIKYNADRVCEKCTAGYHLLDNKTCQFQNTVPNCIEYDGLECSKCAYFYYLENVNKCTKQFIEGCIEYERNINECKKCERPLYLKSVTECAMPFVENCIKYVYHSASCEKCARGTYLSSGKCLKQDIPNCIRYHYNENSCANCAQGTYENADGNCVPVDKTQCIKYSDRTNTCQECAKDYTLEGGQCVTDRTQDGCIEYESVEDNECKRCADGYYLSDETCVNKNDKSFCIDIPGDTSEFCSEIKENYNVSWDKNSQSYEASSEITTYTENCLEYNNSGNCDKCISGFKLETGSCTNQVTLMTDCHQYFGDSGGACSVCRYGYYYSDVDVNTPCLEQTDDADVCLVFVSNEDKCQKCKDKTMGVEGDCTIPKSITHCEEFSESATESTCIKCKNLYYFESGGSACNKITNTYNCDSSDRLTNACQICKNKLGKQCLENLVNIADDNNCIRSRWNQNNYMPNCAKCNSGYALAKMTDFARSQVWMDENNCEEVDHVEGNCILCKSGYILNGSTCNAVVQAIGVLCKKWEAGVTVSKNDNFSCLECIDDKLLYLDGGVCKYRQYFDDFLNCKVYHKDSIGCKECDDDYVVVEETGYKECMDPSEIASEVEGCKYYEDKTKCIICDWNRKKISDTDCSLIDPSTEAFSNRKFNRRFGSMETFSDPSAAVQNCQTYAQIFESKLGCVKCQNGYIGIVSDPESSDVKKFAWALSKDNTVGFDDVVNTFLKCLPATEQYKKQDSTNGTSNSSCLIGYQKDNTGEGYACLLCAKGFLGRVGEVSLLPNGSSIPNGPIGAVIDCSDEGVEMTMENSGMFFTDATNEGDRLVRSSYMGYDTCPSGKRLLYSFITSLRFTNLKFTKAKEQSGEYLKVAYCLDEAKIPEVNGCQVYALTKDFTDTTKLTNGDVLTNTVCAICKPGFLRNDDDECSDWSSKCDDPIPMKHFLGGCRNPKTNISIHNDMQLQFTEASQDTEKVDNCLIQEVNSEECIICDHGFTVFEGKCTLVTDYVLCTARWGLSKEMNDWWNEENKAMRIFNNIVWRFYDVRDLKSNDVDHFTTGCLACADNKIFNYQTSGELNKCKPKSSNSTAGTMAGCAKFQLDDPTRCAVCESTHIIKPNDMTCVDKTPFTGCLEVSDDGNSCKKCSNGFIQTAGKACLDAHCLVMNPENVNECLVCKENRNLDTTNTKICSSTVNSTPTCQHYSPVLDGRCVKCPTANEYPYNIFKRDTDSDNYVLSEFKCKEFAALNRNGWGGNAYEYNYEYIYVDVEITFDSVTTVTKEMSVKTPSALKRFYSKNWTGRDAFCHPAITDANCAEPGAVSCLLCNENKILYNDGTCSTTDDTTNCDKGSTIAGNPKCVQCKDNHYLDADGTTCVERTISKDDVCETPHPTENKCQKCLYEPRWIDANGECQEFTADLGCQTWSPDADECLSCPGEKYWNTSTKACTDRTSLFLTGCKVPHPTEDAKCSECARMAILQADGTCVEQTNFPFCSETNADASECLSCPRYRKFNDNRSDCIMKETEHCVRYTDDPTEDKCESCSDDYYLDNGKCKLKTGVNCETYETSSDNSAQRYCASCSNQFNFNLSKKTCTIKEKKNCYSWDPNSDKCNACSPKYFYLDGECLPKTTTNCKDFWPNASLFHREMCGSCETEQILENGKCRAITKKTCDTFVNGKSKCSSCQGTMYLDTDGETCVWKDAEMCLSLNLTKNNSSTNVCSSCSGLFMLKEKNCERIDVEHCKTYNTTNGRCASCEDDTYFHNDDTKYCEPNTAEMCKTFKSGSLKCADCENDFILDFNQTHCIQKTTKTCNSFDSAEDKCADCGPAFMFDGTGRTCRIKNASNCLAFKSGQDNECQSCSKLFWLDSGGNCIKRVSKNCKTFVTTNEDKCDDCEDGFQLNNTTGQCDANRGKNCVTFRTDKHGCQTCGPRHYLNGLDECVPNDEPNCLKNLEDSSGCDTCSINYFLLDKMCLPKTRKNCPDFASGNTDECGSCTSQFKFDAYQNCALRSAALCDTFGTGSTDECATCKPGFYKNNNDCTSNSSLNCLTFSDSANECASCSSLFYKSSNNCVLKTKKNCLSFEDDEDKCKDCSANFLKNGATFNCDEKTAENCKTFSTSTDTCEECGSLFYKGNTNCERDEVANCKVYNPSSAGCQQCGPEHSKSGCNKNDKTGCLTFKDDANECETCMPDYVLDGDKNCVKNDAELCKSFKNNQAGCDQCEARFVLENETGPDCIANPALNCKEFDDTLELCTKCSDNFVWKSGESKCEANEAENCDSFKETHECETCSNRFFKNDSNKCESVKATGCDLNISQQNKCDTCRAGFYKDGEDCVASSLENCEQYIPGKNECEVCKMGYYPAQVNSKYVCVQVDAPNCETLKKNKNECATCVSGVAEIEKASGLECKTYTAENCETYNSKSDACATCKSTSYMKKVADSLPICVVRLITDCLEFYIDKDNCVECPKNKYMDINGNCLKYNIVEHCSEYHRTEDKCVDCNSGYYKHETENECVENPQGIKKCVKYIDKDTCDQCDSTSYIDKDSNKCLDTTKIIPNCRLFQNAESCLQCEDGFLLQENECLKITADNCDEYLAPNMCKTCLPNYLPNPETHSCEASGIEHCLEPKKLDSQTVCDKCKPGYFLSQHHKSCEPPTRPILGCAEYQDSLDQLRCKTCEDGLALSNTKTECLGVKTLNIAKCERGFYLSNPLCETCYYGYKRDEDGKCVKLENNCALEDINTGVCLLCLPGCNMGSDGVCTGTPSDADPEPIPVDQGDGGDNDDDRKSIEISRVYMLVMLGLIFFGLDLE